MFGETVLLDYGRRAKRIPIIVSLFAFHSLSVAEEPGETLALRFTMEKTEMLYTGPDDLAGTGVMHQVSPFSSIAVAYRKKRIIGTYCPQFAELEPIKKGRFGYGR